MIRWKALAVAAVGVMSAVSAQALECSRARRADERAICASADLRRLDSEIAAAYAQALGNSGPAARKALSRAQRDWVSARNCTGDCLTARMTQRNDALRAFAASGSDRNPAGAALATAWLVGTYVVERPVALGGLSAPNAAGGPEPAGQTMTLSAGKLCVEGRCSDFGLSPQPLADGPGRDKLPALLGLPADAPAFSIVRNGEAVGLLAAGANGAVFALSNACASDRTTCGWVRQDWTRTSGEGLVRAKLGKP